jgi:hypothetical protein
MRLSSSRMMSAERRAVGPPNVPCDPYGQGCAGGACGRRIDTRAAVRCGPHRARYHGLCPSAMLRPQLGHSTPVIPSRCGRCDHHCVAERPERASVVLGKVLAHHLLAGGRGGAGYAVNLPRVEWSEFTSVQRTIEDLVTHGCAPSLCVSAAPVPSPRDVACRCRDTRPPPPQGRREPVPDHHCQLAP